MSQTMFNTTGIPSRYRCYILSEFIALSRLLHGRFSHLRTPICLSWTVYPQWILRSFAPSRILHEAFVQLQAQIANFKYMY
jgi:hypothetical protein